MRDKPAILWAVVVTLSLATAAIASGLDDAFQVRYTSNLNLGDSVVNITNTGAQGGFDPAGNICANVYVFDPNEEMIACCSCLVTPNGLYSLSAKNDLISNPLTPPVPTSIMIKLLATTPPCNASLPSGATLAPGMRAWGTTVHGQLPNPTPKKSGGSGAGTGSKGGGSVSQPAFAVTETAFSPAELSVSELAKLTTQCQFIQDNGSGFGICKACRTGGL